jgi:2-desacetyl-2-hydroxyethyl bacteriochlorophyllide A dehydrogenase
MPNELLLTEPRAIAVRPYGEERLAASEVRAEAIVSGISHGTELALYRGVSPFDGKRFDTDLRVFVDDAARAAYPMPLGYEWVGSVTETGAEVQAPRVGDLVHLSLPHRETHTFAVDDDRKPLTPLPAALDPERAALLSSATIALQAIHDARVNVGDSVAVFGLGVFGLLTVQLARLSGARWIAGVDPFASRRELAGRLGADAVLDPAAADAGREIKLAAGRGGVDAAIEFSGRYSGLHAALRSARLAGTVVAAGFYTGGAGDDLRLGEEWHHNRLTLVSSMSGWAAPHREAGWDRPRLRATVLELIASRRLEVGALVTQRIPFAEAAGAYDLIDREPETALKVVLEYRARG